MIICIPPYLPRWKHLHKYACCCLQAINHFEAMSKRCSIFFGSSPGELFMPLLLVLTSSLGGNQPLVFPSPLFGGDCSVCSVQSTVAPQSVYPFILQLPSVLSPQPRGASVPRLVITTLRPPSGSKHLSLHIPQSAVCSPQCPSWALLHSRQNTLLHRRHKSRQPINQRRSRSSIVISS